MCIRDSGRGVRRRGRTPRPHRRREAAARRPGRGPGVQGPLHPRGAVRRRTQPPRRRRRVRLGRGPGRPEHRPVHRHGAGRGPHHPRPADQRRGPRTRAGAHHHLGRARGPRVLAPARHRAPRHQARERHHHRDRRGQGDGLRHRPRPARRPVDDDPDRHGHGHPAVPVARAGPRQGRGPPLRPVRDRLSAVRTARAAAPVHRRDPAVGGLPARPGRARPAFAAARGPAHPAGARRSGHALPRQGPGRPVPERRGDARAGPVRAPDAARTGGEQRHLEHRPGHDGPAARAGRRHHGHARERDRRAAALPLARLDLAVPAADGAGAEP